MLVHPHPNAATCITTDASNVAVLEQFIEGQWKPISFFSKKLTPAELNYSAFDRELLAAYLAVRHFQYFVEGQVFHSREFKIEEHGRREARPEVRITI